MNTQQIETTILTFLANRGPTQAEVLYKAQSRRWDRDHVHRTVHYLKTTGRITATGIKRGTLFALSNQLALPETSSSTRNLKPGVRNYRPGSHLASEDVRKTQIMKIMAGHGEMSMVDMSRLMGLGQVQLRRLVALLRIEGRIAKIGNRGRGVRYVRTMDSAFALPAANAA
jgi:hypothetical protein